MKIVHIPDRSSLILAWLLMGAGVSNAQLINGDFQTGNFTGWTLFNTLTGGTAVADVVPFDTLGSGTPSLSAQFQVGETSGPPLQSPGQGAGLYQNLPLKAGVLNISLNIASLDADPNYNNSDGGTFELLLDGTVVASDSIGLINPNQIIRSTLNYSGTVTAGTHQIEIEMLREFAYATGADPTPYQFIDNIEAGGTAIPEPNAGSLLAFGIAAVWLQTLERSYWPGAKNTQG